jgi:hypothetical protein
MDLKIGFTSYSLAVIITRFDHDAVTRLLVEIEQVAIPHRHVTSVQINGKLVDSFGILLR